MSHQEGVGEDCVHQFLLRVEKSLVSAGRPDSTISNSEFLLYATVKSEEFLILTTLIVIAWIFL